MMPAKLTKPVNAFMKRSKLQSNMKTLFATSKASSPACAPMSSQAMLLYMSILMSSNPSILPAVISSMLIGAVSKAVKPSTVRMLPCLPMPLIVTLFHKMKPPKSLALLSANVSSATPELTLPPSLSIPTTPPSMSAALVL